MTVLIYIVSFSLSSLYLLCFFFIFFLLCRFLFPLRVHSATAAEAAAATWHKKPNHIQHLPHLSMPDAETHPTNRTKIAHFLFAFPFSLLSFFLLFFGYILFHAISLILLQQLRNFHLLLFSFLGSVIECNCRTESRANVTYHYPRAVV